MRKAFIAISLGLIVAAPTWLACTNGASDVDGSQGAFSSSATTANIDQGWGDDVRAGFHHVSQGSELMPAAWFVALETPDGAGRFVDTLDAYGFLKSDAPPKSNPHGLPIGFSEARDEATSALYGDAIWVGLTCAACHTGRVTLGDKSVVIDGAPNMIDFNGFQRAVLAAAKATLTVPSKLARFTAAVGDQAASPLRDRFARFVDTFDARVRRNPEFVAGGVSVPWGPGRLDGFGMPTNESTCKLAELGSAELRKAIENPANCTVSQPAASTPHLWGITKMDFVQWGGNVHTALGRNVGEVNGVYGNNWVEADAQGQPVLRSSADLRGSHTIEGWLNQLKPPRWRAMAGEGLVPPLDEGLVTAGKAIFANKCVQCHAVTPTLTPPDAAGYRYWEVAVTSLDEVGTDPALFTVEATRRSTLPSMFVAPFQALFGPTSVAADGTVQSALYRSFTIRGEVLAGFAAGGIAGTDVALLSECRDLRAQSKSGYKARTLEGIVFTAPYLHNGSVPTLEDLLKPAAERPRSFYVGCSSYDVRRLGYACDASSDHAFLFDTALPTNGNAGHEFGTDLSADDRAALLEYMKSLEEPAAPPVPPGGVCRF